MSAPALTFLAPPSTGHDVDDTTSDGWDHAAPTRSAAPPPRDRRQIRALRMTRGAREAATGMGIADADIRRCLDAPDDVSPHPDQPTRTRFRRGSLVVLAGDDGMVLRVGRRNR